MERAPDSVFSEIDSLERVLIVAESVFGSRDKASIWLRQANADLGDEPPIRLLKTESGAQIVEDALMRIEYGVFS